MRVNVPAMRMWLIALRSGMFTQVRKLLHVDHGGYCCLGVACNVAYIETLGGVGGKWRPAGRIGGVAPMQSAMAVEGSDKELPGDVALWLFGDYNETDPTLRLPTGMLDPIDEGEESYESLSFSGMNDEAKLSFEQIADVAEWYFSDQLDPEWRMHGVGTFGVQTLRPYEARQPAEPDDSDLEV